METIENISMREIERYINNSEYMVIDLRSPGDYMKYHIDGAVNIPYESLINGEIELPHRKKAVLYCEHGGVSIMAAKKLMRKGYIVINTIGGITAYKRLKQK